MFENALLRMRTQRILRKKTGNQYSNYVSHICVTVKFHHFKSLSLSELLLELSCSERERRNCRVFLFPLKRAIRKFCVISHAVTAKKGSNQCDVRPELIANEDYIKIMSCTLKVIPVLE